jgi:surface antigen
MKYFRRSKKRVVRYSLLTLNIVLLVAVIGFIISHSGNSAPVGQNALLDSRSESLANPLDQLSSADIAVHIALAARLDQRVSVSNKADSVNAQLALVPADDRVIAKPQVVATALKSKQDIQFYVTKEGDTLSSIASRFGVSSDSIRWSNGLTTGVISPGKELILPPHGVNGIVYTVKEGDTPASLAERYRANRDAIIAFNDAEVSGLTEGEKIVIPDGLQPVQRTYGSFAWNSYAAVYSGNGYDYGYCTWWAALRRAQVGKPIPSNLGNASTWKVLSQRAGLPVSNTPSQYAVIWTPPRDYYGHVGFVEQVFPDGSIRISEMNTVGWNRVSEKTLSPAQAAGYSYIH